MCDVDTSGKMLQFTRKKNAPVIITRAKLTNITDFSSILEQLHKKKGTMELIIFCDDFDPLVLTDVAITRAKHNIQIVIVKMPTLWKDEWYEDLSLTSGATVIDPAHGLYQ